MRIPGFVGAAGGETITSEATSCRQFDASLFALKGIYTNAIASSTACACGNASVFVYRGVFIRLERG